MPDSAELRASRAARPANAAAPPTATPAMTTPARTARRVRRGARRIAWATTIAAMIPATRVGTPTRKSVGRRRSEFASKPPQPKRASRPSWPTPAESCRGRSFDGRARRAPSVTPGMRLAIASGATVPSPARTVPIAANPLRVSSTSEQAPPANVTTTPKPTR